MPETKWRRLERRVKAWFQQCGCSAEKTIVSGPGKIKYEIDCLVTFEVLGLPTKWIVECKDWGSRLPQDVAASLRQRVTDTGADKGILVCPSGFQIGALNQAEISSLMLITPERLEETLFAEFRLLALQAAFSQIRQLKDCIVDYRLKLEDFLYAYDGKRNIDKEYEVYQRLLFLHIVLTAAVSHLEEWEAGRPSLGPPAKLPPAGMPSDMEWLESKTDFVDDREMLIYVLSLISKVRDRVKRESKITAALPKSPRSPMAPSPAKSPRYFPTAPKQSTST